MGSINNPQLVLEDKKVRTIVSALLLQNSMTQSDLARKLGVDKAYISRIINSKEDSSTQMKIDISKVFGVDSRIIWED